MPNAVKIRKGKENIEIGDENSNDKGVSPHLIVIFIIYGLSVGATVGRIERDYQRDMDRADRQFNEMMDRIEHIQYYDYD